MAYNKHTWVARQGVGLNKFTDQNGNRYEFTPSPDEVTQPGTPFSAEWMNEMEDGIAAAGIIYGVCRTAESVSEKTVDTGGAPERLATGDHFRITFENAVQAGATLNINSLGAYPIIDNYTGEAIVLGDISAGYIGDIVYEDGRFVLLNAYRAAATPTGSQLFTENSTFTVPARVTSIRISACAAGISPYAGEGILNQIYDVVPGQNIPLTIGAGNTIIGDLITLAAGSVASSTPTTKLGYATGYKGGDASYSSYKDIIGGYAGFFGFGGGAGGYYYRDGTSSARDSNPGSGGGIGGNGTDGGKSGSDVASGGGTTGGAGGHNGSPDNNYGAHTNGSNATSGTLIYSGGSSTSTAGKGGSGSIYGAGGGGGAHMNNDATYRYGGGGGAGGYGAGGGQSGRSGANGKPSNGMVLIEWGFSL